MFVCSAKQENQEKVRKKQKEKEFEFVSRADGRTLGSKTSPGLNFNCIYYCVCSCVVFKENKNKNKI